MRVLLKIGERAVLSQPHDNSFLIDHLGRAKNGGIDIPSLVSGAERSDPW